MTHELFGFTPGRIRRSLVDDSLGERERAMKGKRY